MSKVWLKSISNDYVILFETPVGWEFDEITDYVREEAAGGRVVPRDIAQEMVNRHPLHAYVVADAPPYSVFYYRTDDEDYYDFDGLINSRADLDAMIEERRRKNRFHRIEIFGCLNDLLETITMEDDNDSETA